MHMQRRLSIALQINAIFLGKFDDYLKVVIPCFRLSTQASCSSAIEDSAACAFQMDGLAFTEHVYNMCPQTPQDLS